MPRIQAWAVRAALVQFVLAASAGGLTLLHRAFPEVVAWSPPPGVHAELALMGFMLPFALGVAAWILPRPGPLPNLAVGSAFVLLHLGVLLMVLGSVVPQATLPGRVAQGAGLILLVIHIVPRVRGIAGRA